MKSSRLVISYHELITFARAYLGEQRRVYHEAAIIVATHLQSVGSPKTWHLRLEAVTRLEAVIGFYHPGKIRFQ
jgi:hypothetical protein